MSDQEVSMTGRVLRPEVMVSYSSRERQQVLQIVQRLRAAGVAVWIDQSGIDGAQRWSEEIVNAIEACKTVLLMVSRNSMQSENISKEVSIAWEGGKQFLPLYLEEATIPKSMRYPLSGIQHIKLYEGDPEAKFVSVLRSLVRLGVHVSPYYIALISAETGDREQAFEWLNKACDERSGGLAHLKTEPRFASLKSDPRFADVAKRAESTELESEDASAQIPVVLPRPVPVPAAAAGPIPLWKKILWPEIYDDHSARQAAALGIWTSAFLIVASILLPIFLTSLVGALPAMGMGWNNPILFIVMFGPIAFGIQKMGRPAAIIGLVFCSLGAIANLFAVTSMQAAVNAYSQYSSQYGAPNPYLAQYYASWFGLSVGAICVFGFGNATRGTFAYRQMVLARQAEDKQVAITKEEFTAIKASFFETVKKLRGAVGAKIKRKTTSASLPKMPVGLPVKDTPPLANAAPVAPAGLEPNESRPLPMPLEPRATEQLAASFAAKTSSFAELIGARGDSRRWLRAVAFVAANVIAGLTYILWLSATSNTSIAPVYWQFNVAQKAVFSLAALGVFWKVPKTWKAAAVAGAIAAVAALPFCALLPTFVWGDIIYREQFQQFVLLPFLNNFVLLLGLAWAVPRVKPTPLALWVGAMGAEVITPLLANILRMLGAGQPTDQMLSGTSVVFAVIRSLIFAGVLWGLLRLTRQHKIFGLPGEV